MLENSPVEMNIVTAVVNVDLIQHKPDIRRSPEK